MCTVRSARPPVKPRPSEVTDVDLSPAGKGTGALYFLNVWQGSKLSSYWLLPLTCPDGVAFQFQASRTKPAGEMQADAYDVGLFLDGSESCDCVGHERWGHCKHVGALRMLIARGKLPAVPHGDRCPCSECERLVAYRPAGHDHGLPF
jgi:hypothetical protein